MNWSWSNESFNFCVRELIINNPYTTICLVLLILLIQIQNLRYNIKYIVLIIPKQNRRMKIICFNRFESINEELCYPFERSWKQRNLYEEKLLIVCFKLLFSNGLNQCWKIYFACDNERNHSNYYQDSIIIQASLREVYCKRGGVNFIYFLIFSFE